jgi:hypothetical protein
MARRSGQRGEGKAGCIFWMAVLFITVLACWKLIPVKINNAELVDYITEVAQFQSQSKTQVQLADLIIARAMELNIPVTKENLTVVKTGDRIRVTLDYVHPVRFPGYTYNWHFRHELDRPIFIT